MFHVCIVDDHPIVADGIRRLLQTEDDIRVVADYRSISALESDLKTGDWNIAIVDILLKEDSGIRGMQVLRDTRPDVKVIALSMYSTEPYVGEAISAGAKAYVTKGRAHDEIIPAIRAVGRGQRYYCPEVKALLDDGPKTSKSASIELTERENEVFRHLALGLAPKQIAGLLSINAKTVHVHKANIAKKLDIQYQSEFVKAALARGVIAAEDLTL